MADDEHLEPTRVLSLIRPLVVVVEAGGVVRSAYGGQGGFMGYDPDALVGRNVLEMVSPAQVDDVATYFVESLDEAPERVTLPLPFRIDVIGADGREHPADVVPTAVAGPGGAGGWVAIVMPLSLGASVTRSLDAELSGASRRRVKELLCEELAVENEQYTTRWFLIDLTDAGAPTVATSRTEDLVVADAIANALVTDRWRPWHGAAGGEVRMIPVDGLPAALGSFAADRHWRRAWTTAVTRSGDTVAAYVSLSRVPDDDPVDQVRTNVAGRVSGLVDVTALIFGRWAENDRLVRAATSDPLTGLANRPAFDDALADARGDVAVLYADIDRFKQVNDRHGHHIGDRVLVEVARRLQHACRPTDVVARFGGDEFVVLLPAVDLDDAAAIGERMVEAVAAPLGIVGGPDSVSISVGLAYGRAGKVLVQRADHALRTAKRSGRSRLVSSSR